MDTNTQLQLILDEMKKINERVSHLETQKASHEPSLTVHAPVGKKVSIKEHLIDLKPTDDVQRTLAIAHYLETSEGMTSFNKGDIDKGFRASKEKVPSNTNDKISMCVKNGHMMEAEEKKDSLKAWTLTSTGEKFILNGFRKSDTKK